MGLYRNRKLLVLLAVFWQLLNTSAYCETGNRTASGVWPTAFHTCAADHLPFGTKIILPDQSVWTVEDRFGGNYKDHLDLYVGDYDTAIRFGRQYLNCKIITPD